MTPDRREDAATTLRPRGLRRPERWYLTFALLYSAGAFLPQMANVRGGSVATGDGVAGLVQASVYGLLAVFIGSRWQRFWPAFKNSWWIWLPVIVGIASTFWSDSPALSLRRGIVLGATTLLGVYIGARLTLHALIRLICTVCTISMVASAAWSIALPEWGVMQQTYQGAWRGIFVHKNVLARLMTLATLSYVIAAHARILRRPLCYLGVAGALLTIALTQSATQVVTATLLLALAATLRGLRWHPSILLPAVGIAALSIGGSIWWVNNNAAYVVGALGRDLTLTGRTPVWGVVLESIADRFWLGYGLNAFWGGANSAAGEVWEVAVWQPVHAHNGLLDLWLDLGFVGVLAFSAGYLIAVVRSVRMIRSDASSAVLWPLLILALMFASNITESALFWQNSVLYQQTLLWVLYVAVFTLLANGKSIEKRQYLRATPIAPQRLS